LAIAHHARLEPPHDVTRRQSLDSKRG
jgi:hypothetical protein